MDEKWMQEAVKDYEGDLTSECIIRDKKSKDIAIRKFAVLAETLAKYSPKKKGDLLKVYVQAKVAMDFNEITHEIEDFQDYEAVIEADDFSHYYGRLTRAGPFKYEDGIKHKDYKNIKKNLEQTSHSPVFGSRVYGSHNELSPTTELVGFATNWDYHDKSEDVFGDVFFFKDIGELSDLKNPTELPVSFKFDIEDGESDVQNITKFHHLAVSLNKLEDDRCGLTGNACNISPKQNLPITVEASDSNDLQTGTADSVTNKKLNKKDSVEDMSKELKGKEKTSPGAGKPTPDQNAVGKEIEGCTKSGQSEQECKEQQKRLERNGKYEESQDVKKSMPKKDLDELADITLEDLTEIIEDYEAVIKENAQLKEGSKALLTRLDSLEIWQKKALALEKVRDEEDLTKLKEDLKAKGVCDTYLENRGLEQLQDFAAGLTGLDKGKYLKTIQDLSADDDEEITATSLADMGKTIEDARAEYDYLKL